MFYFIAIMNIVTFVAYCTDKILAMLKKRRISERTLLLFALCFGAIGAMVAMLIARHKIRKPAFFIPVVLMFIVQVAAIILYIFYNGVPFWSC